MPVTQEELEALVGAFTRGAARMAEKHLAEPVGVTVLLFNFGPDGSMAYASNANRRDMISALRELIYKLEMS